MAPLFDRPEVRNMGQSCRALVRSAWCTKSHGQTAFTLERLSRHECFEGKSVNVPACVALKCAGGL